MAMASSSDEALDESIPEMVYQCISLSDAAHYRKEDSYVKCPLCNKYQFGSTFHCADCVKNGNFSHSRKKCFERFADKKARKYKLKQEEEEILEKYQVALAKKIEKENVKLDIELNKEKIKLLQKIIKSRKEEISKEAKLIEELKVKKSECRKRGQVISAKISRLREINEDKDVEVKRLRTKLSYKDRELQTYQIACVKELMTYIIPITKVPPNLNRYASLTEEGQYAELEDAQKTTYIQGQWVIAGSPMDDVQYSIVEPLIPAHGDYSSYMLRCNDLDLIKDNLSEDDKRRFDEAYGIGAALSYSAQLVNVLSYIMNIYLPKRYHFNDFCNDSYKGDKNLSDEALKDKREKKFYHNVAKLNANIIHMCLTQKVDITALSAHRTISNILLLIEPKPKSRRRSLTIEEREEILASLENSISRDMLSPDESDDDIEAEFVHISDEEDYFQNIPESSPPTPPSSLVSSVFSSFWKTATGQK